MTTDDKLAVSQEDVHLVEQWCRQWRHCAGEITALYEVVAQARAAGERAGMEKAAAWLRADAKLCDCSALEDRECACGAWDDYKTVAMTDLIDRFETECIRAASTGEIG